MRPYIRSTIWMILFLTGLILLCGMTACSGIPPKQAPVVLPSTVPVQKRTQAVKQATAESKASAEAARDEIDRAIVLAHQEAVAANDAERTQSQQALRVSLEQAKAKADDSATKAALSDQRASDAVKEVETLRQAQDKTAIQTQAIQDENEAYRQRELAGHKWGGLGFVWIGLKMFAIRALAWIAGFAVILGALAFLFPPVMAFLSVIATNLINLFKKR